MKDQIEEAIDQLSGFDQGVVWNNLNYAVRKILKELELESGFDEHKLTDILAKTLQEKLMM